ncbi:MarC family protein [Candidatus Chlamydia sanziniae]|uniref:UPF0056 membrane protein n=1 Tax=Candidatus Chlamydia sanziniae TaxID=1806891 RepID=A0A1A9HUX0_9CHLA|nr:MarC family protein [Candidatus Chlamydia sanziniae]ANH78800.1 Multiple antibiotic resistance protein marC [Candidatus Chlamydia sanziniae]
MLTILNLSLLFYILFDAPGSIPVFVSLLKNYSHKKQQSIILRECLFALAILLLFITFGRKFFQFLDISLYSFQIIGGILLLIVALRMMNASLTLKTSPENRDSEPIFFPLAFPIITGPAIIIAILSYMEEDAYPKDVLLIGLVIAWTCSLVTLLCSSLFNRVLGVFGLLALERLFSLALFLMSGDLILKGISTAFNIGFYIR